ncbi:MAG: hypothetical protein ACLR7U_09170 [Ruthenibacterium lactatiformans]
MEHTPQNVTLGLDLYHSGKAVSRQTHCRAAGPGGIVHFKLIASP